MADNVAITAGSGTTIGTDDVAGVQIQRVKTTWGPDGTANDADVASGKPMPVQLRGSDGTDRSNALPVSAASGTIASGAIASGAVASGAFASGALASGSVASGAMVDLGAIADAVVAAGATGSVSAKLRRATQGLEDLKSLIVLAAGNNNIGDVDVATVPTDPFGVNADAASATGSISAKLRAIATATGTTAFTRGAGAVDSNTLRVTVDSTQTDGSEYETVATSQTNQVIGATGAAGDFLSHVIVSPATAGCGVVTIFDNATTIAAFPGGGTTALPTLIPFIIPIGITSVSGAWKITTGANVTCTAVGNFT